jgi:hypothetical protein
MLQEMPMEKAAEQGRTLKRMKEMSDAGLSDEDITYRALAHEAQARQIQAEFMKRRQMKQEMNPRLWDIMDNARQKNINKEPFWNTSANVGNYADPEVILQQGYRPEDFLIHPSRAEYDAVGQAAGLNTPSQTIEPKGLNWLYNQKLGGGG